ncbi:DUF2141 domain-containing protein [Sphingomonas sp.]|uniref:DUF2141 domain-containing protein n=1 Tax=Sphingomonas sp. TaxID=28214 RepID=UPI003CC57A68
MLRAALAAQLFAVALIALTHASPVPAHVLDEDAAACRSGQGPAIQVNVSGLRDRSGELWAELYPNNEADFLADDTALVAAGKTFRRVRTHPAAAGAASVCVRVPHPGRYALLLRHNRTGRDSFSMWNDGIGFAGHRAIGRSRPHFDQASIEAGSGVTVIGVQMQYLHGLRGFQPS